MGVGNILRGLGLGMLAMAANVAVAFLWVWFYSFAIEPGHDGAFYQAYAERVSPISSIVAGVPILLGLGWLAARWARASHLPAALMPAIVYVAIDAGVIFGMVPDAVSHLPILLVSWATKLAAGATGGWLALRGRTAKPPVA